MRPTIKSYEYSGWVWANRLGYAILSLSIIPMLVVIEMVMDVIDGESVKRSLRLNLSMWKACTDFVWGIYE